MIARVGERAVSGRAVDLEVAVPTERVGEAVRSGSARAGKTTIEVVARAAGPLHHRVGCIGREPAIRPRTALARAARSRGWTSPVDHRLAVARERLASAAVDPPTADLAARRRLVAEATAETEALRERVAEARGRVLAGGDGEATLEAAVRELSEVETAAAAAREAHERARRDVGQVRERLRERLGLADQVGNLERRARAALVERARPAYRAALGAVPGVAPPVDPFDAPPDAMALSIARVGRLAAPVVLGCGRFPDARAASRWLRAPVIRLEP